MTYTRHIVHGAGVIFITSVLAGLLSYGLRIVLARHLGPQDYGLFYAVFNVVIFFLFFRDLGLGQALVRYISSFKAENKFNEIKTTIVAVFLIQLFSSLIMAAIFFVLANFLATTYFKDPRAELMLQILTLYIIFSVLFITLKSTFLGFQRSFAFASFDFSKNLLVLLLVIILLKLGFTVLAPVIAYVLVCLLLFLLYFPFLLRVFPFFTHQVSNIKPLALQTIAFGLPVLISSIGGRVIGYIDTLFLTYFRPLSDVGIYNAVLPSAMIFVDIGTSLGLVVFPLAAELVAKKDTLRLAVGFDFVHRYFFPAVLPVIIAIIFFARYLITTFFGEAYSSGTLAFQILLLGVLCLMIGGINNSIIVGMGNPKAVTKITIWAAVANVILNIFLIPARGITGAAVATLLSYAMILFFSTHSTARTLQIPFPLQSWCKIFIAGMGFTATLFFMSKLLMLPFWVELAVDFAVAFPVYLVLCFRLKLFKFEEIKRYFRLVI